MNLEVVGRELAGRNHLGGMRQWAAQWSLQSAVGGSTGVTGGSTGGLQGGPMQSAGQKVTREARLQATAGRGAEAT